MMRQGKAQGMSLVTMKCLPCLYMSLALSSALGPALADHGTPRQVMHWTLLDVGCLA